MNPRVPETRHMGRWMTTDWNKPAAPSRVRIWMGPNGTNGTDLQTARAYQLARPDSQGCWRATSSLRSAPQPGRVGTAM